MFVSYISALSLSIYMVGIMFLPCQLFRHLQHTFSTQVRENRLREQSEKQEDTTAMAGFITEKRGQNGDMCIPLEPQDAGFLIQSDHKMGFHKNFIEGSNRI